MTGGPVLHRSRTHLRGLCSSRPDASTPAPGRVDFTAVDARSLGEETLSAEGSEPGRGERPLGRGDLVGRYILLDLVGQGATGRVFSAYDPSLDRRVAIKILRESAAAEHADLDRSLHEAKAMARIDHPHVVTVHDAGIHEGAVFIAMELVQGTSLDAWLRVGRSRAEIVDVFIDAARGLGAAHAAGVVHRDFKPANVIVTEGGRAKVGDFGLAGIEERVTPVGEDGEAAARSVGTPAYMSPEHVRGVGIDARSDQFSFVVALHEALEGERPFQGDSIAIVAARIVEGSVAPSVASARGRLGALVRRGLAIDPAARFASMGEVAAELERIRRPRWPWAVGALAGASMIALAAAWTGGSEASCPAGSERVDEVLEAASSSASGIGGDGYTEEFVARARERFTRGLSSYGSEWAAEHDRSCAVVGPEGERGTPPERLTAQCLHNRLEAMRGLVEIVGTRVVDAGHVDAMLDALPGVDDCRSGHWVPSPSDPEVAARVTELDEAITQMSWARIADQPGERLEQVRAIAEEARALAEPYLLSRALAELARHEADQAQHDAADAHLSEAMNTALAAGLDWQAAHIVNHMLVENSHRDDRLAVVPTLAAIGRGLVARAGGGERLLGLIALNESLALRKLDRPREAFAMLDRATEHFRAADSPGDVVKARITRVSVRVGIGELELALKEMQDLAPEIEATLGADSREAILADQNLASTLAYAGKNREAVVAARRAYQRAQKRYAKGTRTFYEAAWSYAASSFYAGDLDEAETTVELLRTLPVEPPEDLFRAALQANVLVARGRYEEAGVLLDDARGRADPAQHRMQWMLIRFERARVAYLLGNDEAARAVFDEPQVRRFVLEGTSDHALRLDAVCLATIVGATEPPSEGWMSVLERLPALTPNVRATARVARAVAKGDVAEVRRERDALAQTYFEGAPEVRTLDAWLSRRR